MWPPPAPLLVTEDPKPFSSTGGVKETQGTWDVAGDDAVRIACVSPLGLYTFGAKSSSPGLGKRLNF